jgi:prevent-host-death family protein
LIDGVIVAAFGAFEAKNRFGHLLDLVEQGEDVLITRHGREVARLVPAHDKSRTEQSRAAFQRLSDRAKKLNLGPFDWDYWKGLRDEGRR